MRYRLIISILIFIILCSGVEAGLKEALKTLNTTPYVDVAKKTLQKIDYGLKDGSLKPSEEIVDALIPIVKKEPYLLKDALEVLYDLPERMLYSRDDLYQALNRWKNRPEVMDFLSRRGGPLKKAMLMEAAIHGSAQEADRAVAALTRMPLNSQDLKKLIKHYLTRQTEQYFYLTQFLRAHPEEIPSMDGRTLRQLSFLLLNNSDCSVGVKLFSRSGREGLRMLFKRWYRGRLAGGCEYETYEALRKGAKEIMKEVLKALPEEDDPLVKGQLVVLLFDSGRDRLAKKWADELSEEAALQLINAYADKPEELREKGIVSLLSKINRGRLTGYIENLKRTLLCDDLNKGRKQAIRTVLNALSGKKTALIEKTLQRISYCKTHPPEVMKEVVEIALNGDPRIRSAALRVFSGRAQYCGLVEEVKGILKDTTAALDIKAEGAGFISLCRAWDKESFRLTVDLIEHAGIDEKDLILRSLTTSEVFPEDALRRIQDMYKTEKDPNLRLSLQGIYLRGLSRSEQGLKSLARMIARAEVDEISFSVIKVPERLRRHFGEALLKELHWWDDWMLNSIDIPADLKAESLVRTALSATDKPLSERLLRLETAVKLSENTVQRHKGQLLSLFRENLKQWLSSEVQTPGLNRALGPEGTRLYDEYNLKSNILQRLYSRLKCMFAKPEELRLLNTSGFVPLPPTEDTVEFYAGYLRKTGSGWDRRFSFIMYELNRSLMAAGETERHIFSPLVPLLKRHLSHSLSPENVNRNKELRNTIKLITGRTPPPTDIEIAYEKEMENSDLDRVDRMTEEAIKRARPSPPPFEIEQTEVYSLRDGQRVLVISFVLPKGYAIIRPQEPFCIDYDREYPEQVEMDSPADRPYRWYVYKLLRKGYNKPVKLEFYWSRDFDLKKGMQRGVGDYSYYMPKKVYKSTLTLKQRPPERFSLRIKDDGNAKVIETPFPVQDIWYKSYGAKPLDGSVGRDCKRRFQIDTDRIEPEYLRVVLSATDGYYLKP